MNQMLAGRANGRAPECQSSGVPHLVTPSMRRWAVRIGRAATWESHWQGHTGKVAGAGWLTVCRTNAALRSGSAFCISFRKHATGVPAGKKLQYVRTERSVR